MTLCRAAVQDVLVTRLRARRGLDLQLPLQDRPQRLVLPHRQVPPLGLPPSGPVANCPTTTPIVCPSHPRTVKPSTPSLLVGASSATWHHTISTTVTRCVAVSYAAVVEYEDVAYASLGQSDEERVRAVLQASSRCVPFCGVRRSTVA